jgi:hypothetical protein
MFIQGGAVDWPDGDGAKPRSALELVKFIIKTSL